MYAPYCRTSSDEQRDAETIKTQIQELKKSNLELGDDWFLDDGVSGTIPFHLRPEGARLLSELRTGKYEGIAALNHKRLGRTALVIHQLVEDVERQLGFDIIAIREPVPKEMSAGARALMRSVYAGVAESDRLDFLAITYAGKERAAREGRWNGGKPPFGFRTEAIKQGKKTIKKLVVWGVQAQIVSFIFISYSAGMSQARIADLLNSRGVKHPFDWGEGREGNIPQRWYQGTISPILRRAIYKGVLTWRETRMPRTKGTHQVRSNDAIASEEYQLPAIVPAELWERCAVLRSENLRMAPRNARRTYLLGKLIKCGVCGRTYSGTGSEGRRPYYQCTSQMNGKRDEHCGNRPYRADKLEQAVWAEIVKYARNPGQVVKHLHRRLRTQGMVSQNTAQKEKQITKLIAGKLRDRDRAVSMAVRGLITEADLQKQNEALQGEIRTLEAEREQFVNRQRTAEEAQAKLNSIEDLLAEIATKVETMTPQERAKTARQLIAGIVITTRINEQDKPYPHAHVTYAFSRPEPSSNDIACTFPLQLGREYQLSARISG